jgi:hypothetical protein
VQTATYPVAPTTTKRRSTLLDVASVRPGIAWLDGNDLFETFNCMRFDASDAAYCNVNDLDLDTQGPTWIDGFRFVAYGAVTCKAVGTDITRMRSEAERVFGVGESFAVETALRTTRFVEEGSGTPLWEAPPDLTPTPGTAVSPEVGVALLEAEAATLYAGVPTLHVPVTIGSLLAQRQSLVEAGGMLTTRLGSKVAVGAGYEDSTGPDGTDAAAGTKWLYATGEVLILQGETIVPDVPVNLTNDAIAMVQRPYVAAIDCFAAAVLVEVE